MVESAISVAVGAMMHVVNTRQGYGFSPSTVGQILMLAGATGIVVSAMVISWSLSSDKYHHLTDRQVTDLRGGLRTAHHEVKRLTQRVMSSTTTRPSRQILPARGTSDCRNVVVNRMALG